MKNLMIRMITLLTLLFAVCGAHAQCHSKLTVYNNTDDGFSLDMTGKYNNVERFKPVFLPPHSEGTTDWYSNNGLFDSTGYWLHLGFKNKLKEEVLKISVDATDENLKNPTRHICRPDNLWIVSGYLCSHYSCTMWLVSDSKEQADFVLSIHKK